MRDLPPGRTDSSLRRLAASMVPAAVGRLKNRDLTLRHKRGQAFQPGHGMASRFATAQSTVAMRRWGPPTIVTLAAMALLTALTGAAAAQTGAPRLTHRGDGAARCRRADHGDRVDQEPAGHFLRCRRLDPARAGVDRHHGTRDAGRRVRRRREGQGPPLDHV